MASQAAQESWDQIDKPWRLAVQLAWDAHCAGNIGVGAVVTDERDVVIAEGRNRTCDEHAPPGHLHQTFIAHAEIDVLGQLKPGNYSHHTIWTTLEPCLLCTSAIVMSNIGSVRFAARDQLWDFLSRLPEIGKFVADRWPERKGPLQGPIAVFCELLPVIWFLSNKPAGVVVGRYAECHPALLDLAKTLVHANVLTKYGGSPAEEVLQDLWCGLSGVDRAD